MASSRSRRVPSAASRRPWLRAIALLLGVLVLLAHTITLKEVIELPVWWHVDWPDLVKHISLISTFTLAYRLSFRAASPAADRASAWLCSGWAGFCECLQHFIPARDFSIVELAANSLTPLLVIALLRWLRGWRAWFA